MKKLIKKIRKWWDYFYTGVWSEPRSNFRINTVKILSLSVQSIFNKDLQGKACAMAFRTMLALIPALALIFAIGRGFGFQKILEDELYGLFPAQNQAITEALGYVDSYLSTTTEGIFVGIGLLFLLYTLISLISSVEDDFNSIWCIPMGRSIWSKLTDYTAMLLILPVLMICASGLTLFMSSALQSIFRFSFMTPFVSLMLDMLSWVFMCLFFMAAYMLIPNTRVRFRGALIAGVIAGTGFMVLEWIFVSGQIYVTRYNAVYGSFAFVPLLLIWLQLTWVVCLSGAIICFSYQNIFRYTFSKQINDISPDYRRRVTIAVAALVMQSFEKGTEVPTQQSIVRRYGIPVRLVSEILELLMETHIVNKVVIDAKNEVYGYSPAVEPTNFTIGNLVERLDNYGSEGFIPGFNDSFPSLKDSEPIPEAETLLIDIPIRERKTEN